MNLLSLSDSSRRSIRGMLDVIPAILAAIVIMVPVLGLPATQVAKIGAFVGALTLALTKIRNALEDAGVIPAVLKAPASDGADPVPDPIPAPAASTSVEDTTAAQTDPSVDPSVGTINITDDADLPAQAPKVPAQPIL